MTLAKPKPEKLLCLSRGYQTRWVRILRYQNIFWVVDGQCYANLKQAYALEFPTSEAVTGWLNQQQQQGWELIFQSNQDSLELDYHTLHDLEYRMWRILTTPKPCAYPILGFQGQPVIWLPSQRDFMSSRQATAAGSSRIRSW